MHPTQLIGWTLAVLVVIIGCVVLLRVAGLI
jgi:hypothetical protein